MNFWQVGGGWYRRYRSRPTPAAADLAEPFYMAMRNYGPQEPVLNDEWETPAVERME